MQPGRVETVAATMTLSQYLLVSCSIHMASEKAVGIIMFGEFTDEYHPQVRHRGYERDAKAS